MSDRNNERFSALMDGELDDFAQDLEKLSTNEELRQRWMRYHLIRDAVSGHFTQSHLPGLASSVSQALELEPTILAPKQFNSKQILKQVAGLAVAATVSAVAIISIQQPAEQSGQTVTASNPSTVSVAKSDQQNFSPVQTLPNSAEARFAQSQQALLARVGTGYTTTATAQLPLQHKQLLFTNGSSRQATNEKLNSYLINHNEYSVSAKMQGMLPYMRIVGVESHEPVVPKVTNAK